MVSTNKNRQSNFNLEDIPFPVHCTVCSIAISYCDQFKTHPQFPVTICLDCFIKHDETIPTNSCQWCLQEGGVCCPNCYKYFCMDCIKRNVGESERLAACKNTWSCYICDPSTLKNLTFLHNYVMTSIANRNKTHDFVHEIKKAIEEMCIKLNRQKCKKQPAKYIVSSIKHKSLVSDEIEEFKKAYSKLSTYSHNKETKEDYQLEAAFTSERIKQQKTSTDLHESKQYEIMHDVNFSDSGSSEQDFQEDSYYDAEKFQSPSKLSVSTVSHNKKAKQNYQPEATNCSEGMDQQRSLMDILEKKEYGMISGKQDFQEDSTNDIRKFKRIHSNLSVSTVSHTKETKRKYQPEATVNYEGMDQQRSSCNKPYNIEYETIYGEQDSQEDTFHDIKEFKKVHPKLTGSTVSQTKRKFQSEATINSEEMEQQSSTDKSDSHDYEMIYDYLDPNISISVGQDFQESFDCEGIQSFPSKLCASTPIQNLKTKRNYQPGTPFEGTNQERSSTDLNDNTAYESTHQDSIHWGYDTSIYNEQDLQDCSSYNQVTPKNNSSTNAFYNELTLNFSKVPTSNKSSSSSYSTPTNASKSLGLSCGECGIFSPTTQGLDKHVCCTNDSFSTNIVENKTFQIINLPGSDFCCVYCDRNFRNQGALDRHEFKHKQSVDKF